MADLKKVLISISAEEEARGPPARSLDYRMFKACLFFVPTIGLLMFESKYAAMNGVPADSRAKADFLIPVYTGIVVFSIVTVIFTWMFRESNMPKSAGLLNCINAVLVCIMGPMLVWELLMLEAYHFFAILAAAILFVVVCVAVGEWWEKK